MVSIDSKINILDLFAGAGGLSNGFEQTGRFKTIGAVEINEAAVKTFIENHNNNSEIIIKPEKCDKSDITQINFKEWVEKNNIDSKNLLVIGGPPCQGFSNANRQKNFLISGNNQMVKEFYRAIDEIDPLGFVMENVPSIKSKVHKFFITKHIKQTKFIYSSMEHIMEISGMAKEELIKKEILKEDFITLIDINEDLLKEFSNHINNRDLWPNPIVMEKQLVARLRVMFKEISKNKLEASKTTKSDILKLISTLELYENQNNNGWADFFIPLINDMKLILEKVYKSIEIKKEEIECFLLFQEMNLLLLHKKELDDEAIIYEIQIKSKKELTSVIAKVYSYNVVDYLKIALEFKGYKIDMNVINSADYGVPQKRRRFILIGLKNKEIKNKIKLPKEFDFEESSTVRDAIGDLEDLTPINDINQVEGVLYAKPKGFRSRLLNYYRHDNKDSKIFNHFNTKSSDLSLLRFKKIRDIKGKNFHSLNDDLKSTYSDISRTQNTIYLRLNYELPSPTVVNVRKSMWSHPSKARAISIREAARLQSFKDNYIFLGSKDQQYQQIGNAVPPLLARAVAESILFSLNLTPKQPLINELNNEDENLWK